MQLIKMRLCRSYSNLTKTEKLIWSEYQIVRSDWKRLEALWHNEEKPKPRFKYDTKEQRIRPIVKITRYDELHREYMKRGYRLLELALYLYNFGYIAPDFTSEILSKKR